MAGIIELGGDKGNHIRAKIRNINTTRTMSRGGPVMYAGASPTTVSGLVGNVATGSPAEYLSLFAGVALADIPPGQINEILVYGTYDVRVTLSVRGNPTATWPSWPSADYGFTFAPDSRWDNFNTPFNAFYSWGSGVPGVMYHAVLLQAFPSSSGAASSVGGTSLVSIGYYKMIVRAL